MDDPYKVLGVPRSASAADIKQAYRKLAKKLHPDVQQGNQANEQRFKEVTAAYDLLSDAEKRGRFDRGEIDASGAERPQGFGWGAAAGAGGGGRTRRSTGAAGGGRFGGFEFSDDIFADLFGRGGRRGRAEAPMDEGGGADIRMTIRVPFLDAIKGGKHPVQLPDGRVVNVTIPPGTEDGQQLRLRGQAPSMLGASGDVYVVIEVEPHPVFRRDGADIDATVPVTLAEAVLGGTIRVETVDGAVGLKVPPGSNSGTRLRLRGKGVLTARGVRGDHYVTLSVTLPETVDPELRELVERWSRSHPYRVRPGDEG
ncbi:MAG: DnaJ C-terminal domain-containing protein [Alphaproteobacteria bacterium]